MSTTSSTTISQNLETFSIVWLDASVNRSQENLDAQQKLRASINYLRTFENGDDCERYIRSLSDQDQLVLIVSGKLGFEVVPRIHQLRQVRAIYVYCMNKAFNEQWANEYPKIKGVITQLSELVQQIRDDQERRQSNKVNEPFPFSIFKINLARQESNDEFIQHYLLIYTLLQMKSSSMDTTELMNLCKNAYNGNATELAVLQEFKRDYSSERVLWWYTRNSFFYKMFNKALCVENIDGLFRFRSFIYDIQHELNKHKCTLPTCLYRGQLMSDDELRQLKNAVGGYILMHSFLLTSTDRKQTLSLLENTDNLQRVLFEIDAEAGRDSGKLFANISSLSYFSSEQIIMTMLGSIFRIVHIQSTRDRIWIVQLKLFSENDPELKPIIQQIKEDADEKKSSILVLSTFLQRKDKFDEAELLCRRLIKELPHDHPNIADCYRVLGNLVDKKGDRSQALVSYNKALEIWKQASEKDYANMAFICRLQKKYQEALKYYMEALSIEKNRLPESGNPDLGVLHHNIGAVQWCLGCYDVAMEHYKIAFTIKSKSLPARHPHIAMTLENMGLIQENNEEFQEALSNYQEAATIYRQAFSSSHPDVLQIEESIQRVSLRLG